jgi:4-hydroxybenzoate polyprenyltransferase
MSTAARLLVFIEERFPPGVCLPLISILAAAGYVPSAVAGRAALDPVRFFLAVLAMAAALLHLRIVDEIKDADVDRQARPWRPLPRGFVTARELSLWAAGFLVLATALAATLGPAALLGFLPAAGYLVLADLGFGAPERIHRDLLVFALVHSPIVPLLLVFAWCAAPSAAPGAPLVGLVLLGWGVGLGLEVARKTYAPDEERPFLETYSSVVGRPRAVRLASGSLAAGLLGGALYAALAGAAPAAVLAAVVAAGVIAAGGSVLRGAGRRTNEAVGSIVGCAILLWPIGVALVLGGRMP